MKIQGSLCEPINNLNGSKQVKLTIGNHFTAIRNPHGTFQSKHIKNAHRWSIFVSIDNNAAMTSQYISRVVYLLHPC
jgi:hypothetical protein